MGNFVVRERVRRLEEERRDVHELDDWRPATPLGVKAGSGPGGSSIFSGGAGGGSGATAGIGGPPGTSMGIATASGTAGSVLSGAHTASIISASGLVHSGGSIGVGPGTIFPPALSTIGSTPVQD